MIILLEIHIINIRDFGCIMEQCMVQLGKVAISSFDCLFNQECEAKVMKYIYIYIYIFACCQIY
jgi:hypothetical protein